VASGLAKLAAARRTRERPSVWGFQRGLEGIEANNPAARANTPAVAAARAGAQWSESARVGIDGAVTVGAQQARVFDARNQLDAALVV
jgi:hypothetical protein